MKVAIHQVNYMPWLGFFNKLKQANKLVMYDIADYTKNDVQNRNKIRTKEGWIYLTVPIEKKYYRRPFYEVLLSENNKWQNKHWKAIKLNYSKADYFDSYKDFFEKLYKKKFMTLLELNECITIYLIKEFGINLDIIKTTDLELNRELKGTEMLIEILKKAGATTYLAGIGSKSYLDESKFKEIKLAYNCYIHPIYKQQFPGFQKYMSAIDLLFNMGEKSKDLI